MNRDSDRPATTSRRGALGALICAWIVVVAGCANNSGSREVPPEVRAVDACRDRVERSAKRALEAADEQGPFVVPLRFNPARCDAPEYEVRAHGHWVRAYLDGDRETRARLQEFRKNTTQSASFPVLKVEGDFRGRRRAETGLRYPIFWVEQVDPAETPEG